MHFIYAISSINRNYIYVGISENVDKRVLQHNNGKEKTTKPYLPFKLIFTEVCEDRLQARIREKYWKSGTGKRKLKNLRDSKT